MHAAMLMMQIHHEHIRLGLTANWKKCKYGKDEPDSLTPDATAMLNDIDASTVDTNDDLSGHANFLISSMQPPMMTRRITTLQHRRKPMDWLVT